MDTTRDVEPTVLGYGSTDWPIAASESQKLEKGVVERPPPQGAALESDDTCLDCLTIDVLVTSIFEKTGSVD